MIVPKKRTALLVNRLMVALKEAIEESEKQQLKNNLSKLPTKTGDDFSSESIRQVNTNSCFKLRTIEMYHYLYIFELIVLGVPLRSFGVAKYVLSNPFAFFADSCLSLSFLFSMVF